MLQSMVVESSPPLSHITSEKLELWPDRCHSSGIAVLQPVPSVAGCALDQQYQLRAGNGNLRRLSINSYEKSCESQQNPLFKNNHTDIEC